MKHLFSLILLALTSLSLSAQETTKEYLVVTHADASAEEYLLTDIYNVTFNATCTKMYVNFHAAAPKTIDLLPTDSYTFRVDEPKGTEYHNEYLFYPIDTPEQILVHTQITAMQIRKSTDGFWYFYFLDQVNNAPSEQSFTMPQLKVDPKLVNAGELDLSGDVGGKWSLAYKDINLQSHDNEWVCWPDNGTLRIDYDEDAQTCHVQLNIFNSYTSYNGSGLGNHLALTLDYEGSVSAYTGSRK